MKLEKKTPILSLALAATLAATGAQAQEEIRVVSSELMDVLEVWSSPSASYEGYAIEARPDLVQRYLPEVETYHGGRPLVEVFAEQLPQTYAEFAAAIGSGGKEGDGTDGGTVATGGEIDSTELLAYAMATGGDEYARWQGELSARGVGFGTFIERNYPEVVRDVETLNVTPASKGIGLIDFVHSLGDAQLTEEAIRFYGTIRPIKNCNCWTVVNFPDQPVGWTTEINENFSDSWGWAPKKRRNMNYYVYGRGASRDINFWRKAEHTLWEVVRDKSTNVSSMRVRMSCTRNTPNGEACSGPTCRGELVARIGYSSRVYERHDVGGIWSREAQALTADHAKLTYDDPSAAPPTTLFNKGVAVSGQYQSGWNAGAIANILYVAGQVALVVAADGTGAANLLSQDMINTAVNGIAGLITHSGSPGSRSRDMMAAWDNSASTPIILYPNQTHIFDLKASSKLYGRGYGGRSETWGNIDSANYFVAVGRNYQCAANVNPPVARAHWNHGGTSGAPYNGATLQSFVGTFAQTELGIYPPNTGSAPGQFP